MRILKGSFKLEDSSVQISDDKRERMMKKYKNSTLVAALFLILFGLINIATAMLDIVLSDSFKYAGGLLFLLFLISMLVDSHRINKYGLEPKDEYEILADAQAKARAYNFLSAGVLLTIIFLGSGEYALPNLFVLLGMSMLIQIDVLGSKHAKR